MPLPDGRLLQRRRSRGLRLGLLRGYGNAIVPSLAAEFVTAFLESLR